jgi:uncharacterized BrkB/YihY/UPF0761 family membrane protein
MGGLALLIFLIVLNFVISVILNDEGDFVENRTFNRIIRRLSLIPPVSIILLVLICIYAIFAKIKDIWED